MSKTTNKFSPEVPERANGMVLDHEVAHPSQWAAVLSIAAKIGHSPATPQEWLEKTEVDMMAGQLTAFGSPLMGIWTSALDGAHCFAPGGALICEVRMPGVATKPVFAELRRSRLFITGAMRSTPSISEHERTVPVKQDREA